MELTLTLLTRLTVAAGLIVALPVIVAAAITCLVIYLSTD